MADPELIDCPEGEWTPVAINVVAGLVHKKLTAPSEYFQTYRTTGSAAPTEFEEGVPLFKGNIVEEISSVAHIDVYVWCVDKDGQVRVDL